MVETQSFINVDDNVKLWDLGRMNISWKVQFLWGKFLKKEVLSPLKPLAHSLLPLARFPSALACSRVAFSSLCIYATKRSGATATSSWKTIEKEKEVQYTVFQKQGDHFKEPLLSNNEVTPQLLFHQRWISQTQLLKIAELKKKNRSYFILKNYVVLPDPKQFSGLKPNLKDVHSFPIIAFFDLNQSKLKHFTAFARHTT